MARKYGKKNHVKVDPFSYNLMLLGEAKLGKTRLLYEVAEKEVGSDGYIFAEFSREKGASCIEGIIAENISSWEHWIDFVDDIVENKDSDYRDLRVVFIDTYDQYITIAEKEAVDLWNRKNPDKKADSLKQSWGNFDGPFDKVKELMFEQTDRLNEVGVTVWWVGHCKTKEVKDIKSDEMYQIVTSDQKKTYFDFIKKNLHFLCSAYFDRQLQKEKTGRKNIVTKKEEFRTVIKDETRKIRFRDDGYAIDSGSRFNDIKGEIDFDADEFIKTIKDAIRAEIEKSGKSVSERKAENEKEEQENMERIAENEKAAKAKKSIEPLIKEISAFLSNNKSEISKVKPVVVKIRECGYAKPVDIDSKEDAESILELIHSLE